MKCWLIIDDETVAEQWRQAIESDPCDEIEAKDIMVFSWNGIHGTSEEERLEQLRQHIETVIKPKDVVVIDVGLDLVGLGSNGGLALVQGLCSSKKFFDPAGNLTLRLFLVVDDPQPQDRLELAQRGPADLRDRQVFRLYPKNPWEIAPAVFAALTRYPLERAQTLFHRFERDCGAAVWRGDRDPTGVKNTQEWRDLHETIFPEFEAQIQWLETLHHQAFLTEERRRLAEILNSLTPDFARLHEVGIHLPCPEERAQVLFRDFEHDCGHQVFREDQGWRRLRETIFPRFDARIQRLETQHDQAFFAEERRRLREILNSLTPDFARLHEVGIRTPLMEPVEPADEPIDDEFPNKARIAIVEDDPAFVQRLVERLQAYGHSIAFAITEEKDLDKLFDDKSSLIQRLEQDQVELLFLDLKLREDPDDGLQILAALQSGGEKTADSTKTIVLSGFGQDNILKAGKLGAHDYLRKSAIHELRDKIRDVLTKR